MPTDVTAEHQSKTIKEFINDIANLEQEPKEKQTTKEEIEDMIYRIPPNGSSGCDLVLDKVYNDVVVQTIYLFPSLKKYWFFDHKKNKKEELNAKNLKSFLSALHFSSSVLSIDHCVFNMFCKSNAWIEKFLKLIHQPMFLDTAKANVISVRNIFKICDKTCQNWHEYKVAEIWWNGDVFKKDEVNVNPSYLETAKQMMKLLAEKGYSHEDALNMIYGTDSSIPIDSASRFGQAIQFFTVLCDMYGPEFMRSCINDFINNPRMSGLDAKALINLLTTDAKTGNGIHLDSYYPDYKSTYTLYREWVKKDPANKENAIQFSPNSLWNYICVLGNREGQIDTIGSRLQMWQDTLSMEIQLHNEVTAKYPLDLATQHDILSYKCRIYKQFIEENKWKQITDKAKTYEISDNQWMLIAPKTPEDIKIEARQQNNCVASYIQRMIDGECLILFFRKKSNPNDSVCTVEIRNNEIRQFYARFNRRASEEQRKGLAALIQKLEKEKSIKVNPGNWIY